MSLPIRTSVVSCGVLVVSSTHELLLGHATGSARWDIFKGAQEPGETACDAALRELREESGLTPGAQRLLDLGRHAYLPRKDLHLFAMRADRPTTRPLRCTSTFTDRFGRLRPEIDAFEWVVFEQVPARCGKGLARVLTAQLSLPGVAAALAQAAPG